MDLFLEDLYYDSSVNSLQKLGKTNRFYNILLNRYMIFDYFKLDNLLVYDEGFVHFCSMYGNKEKSGKIINKHILGKMGTFPLGIVYCYTTTKENVKRRKNRVQQGNGNVMERTLNHSELTDLCHRSIVLTDNKIKVLKNYDIEILEINMENPIKDNAKQVYDFLKKFE